MAKKATVTIDDLTAMIQRGFEVERQERMRDAQAIRKEMEEGFKAVRKEMADGFKRNDSEHAAIRKDMNEGFTKNDREHEAMLDDILWLKRVDRIEAHLGFTAVQV